NIKPNEILGHQLNYSQMKESNNFISFLIFANKEYFKYKKNYNNSPISNEMIKRIQIIFLQEQYDEY
ncbi:hypothetical protein C6P40_005478, partial [Pichia californica]